MENTIFNGSGDPPICISLGILVWNEEEAIGPALQSVFRQSLFSELRFRRLGCEIMCVANGCTDRTAAIATNIFREQSQTHAFKNAFSCCTVELPERGKINAWNMFVHSLSAKPARVLLLMDGDIVLQDPETLWNMYAALERDPHANIAVDEPIKDISQRRPFSPWDKLSLAGSRMNRGQAQVSGQLYAIRSAVARKIYLPRDLAACEDGFIKALTCTDFLTRELIPERVMSVANASHVFQAYTALADILRNQKRQMIGQTIVHLLVDDALQKLSPEEKINFAQTIAGREKSDPAWLKRLIAARLRKVRFYWRLFPNLLAFRFQRLKKLNGIEKVIHAPVAAVGFALTLWASWLAWRALRQGSTDYWPDTRSPKLGQAALTRPARAEPVRESMA